MKVLFDNKKIKEGIDLCCDVAKESMGKEGNNVLIYNGEKTDIINDGVSIVRTLKVDDPVQQAGVMLAKQCAGQTNQEVGDGTTTTLVLLQSILNELITDTQLVPARELRVQLQEALKALNIKSKKINNNQDVQNVATTASLSKEVGEVIAKIFGELGADASITVDQTYKEGLNYEINDGIQFQSKIPTLYNEATETYVDIPVLVTERATAKDIIEKIKGSEDGKLFIIAPKFDKDAIAVMTEFKMKGYEVAGVQNREFYKEDLEAFIGGSVGKIKITKDETTITGGGGDPAERIKQLKEQKDKEESRFEREKLDVKISFLSGGVATINVGGDTEVAREENYLKVEDAVNATKSAYKNGICKGGGEALYEAGNALKAENEGHKIIKKACKAPKEQMKVEVEDTVWDSVAVVKSSLKNAVSTATSVMTASAAIIEDDD